MNLLNNFVKIFKTKFAHLCLFFIIVTPLSLLALFWLSPYPLPSAVDIDLKRNRSAQFCGRHLCINEWIQRHKTNANISQMYGICPGYGWKNGFINKTIELYQEGKVDWKFMHNIHGDYWNHYCHRKCGIDGPFGFFVSSHKFTLQMTKVWLQHEICYPSYRELDSCRWLAYSTTFRIYSSYFSIPLTIILNYINLTTLLRLLGKGAGPALYLHTAEIVTDGLLNIIIGIHSGLRLFQYFDWWLQSCGYYQYGSTLQLMGVMNRFVSFINQAFLMGLLVDRYYSLAEPYHYNTMTDEQKQKRAKGIILKILLGSFTLHLPFFLFRTFRPIFLYWMGISNFWKENLHQIDFSLTTFYVIISFCLLIFQIICGVLVEKKFRKFIKNKMELNQESDVELKKRERDKQLLLGGTIGLNIITGLISVGFNMVRTQAFCELFGYSDKYPWWSQLFHMADPLLTFVNGNGGLIIHILTVKSYRTAFKATRFGRLIFHHHQVHPG